MCVLKAAKPVHASYFRATLAPPERADFLVLESTYGDRLHIGSSDRQQRLETLIDWALADNGTVLMPAFSLGRTQGLEYGIEDIVASDQKLKCTG